MFSSHSPNKTYVVKLGDHRIVAFMMLCISTASCGSSSYTMVSVCIISFEKNYYYINIMHTLFCVMRKWSLGVGGLQLSNLLKLTSRVSHRVRTEPWLFHLQTACHDHCEVTGLGDWWCPNTGTWWMWSLYSV